MIDAEPWRAPRPAGQHGAPLLRALRGSKHCAGPWRVGRDNHGPLHRSCHMTACCMVDGLCPNPAALAAMSMWP
eukprot:scaffold5048_cov102-Isochrysis_galbana.AAC.4